VKGTSFIKGKLMGNLTAVNFPRYCPLVLVKVVWREGKELGGQKCEVMRNGLFWECSICLAGMEQKRNS
jgi:hypothetical protein